MAEVQAVEAGVIQTCARVEMHFSTQALPCHVSLGCLPHGFAVDCRADVLCLQPKDHFLGFPVFPAQCGPTGDG